jgi:hypothetical protein
MSNARRLVDGEGIQPLNPLRNGFGSPLRELFAPLEHTLIGGGDARLQLDRSTGRNAYGCLPVPCPDTLSFSSCTATSISPRGYEAAERARDAVMSSAIVHGLLCCFDARVEQMRDELKSVLGLRAPGTEVVFSASGTDAQLQVLSVTQALLGDDLTTVIAAADQTGSGTVHTARGHHFGDFSSNGIAVRRGMSIAGTSVASIALRLRDDAGAMRSQSDNDALVLRAVEAATARGGKVMLQVMDGSKLGWRAPSDACVAQIAARWPGQVQVVVDACQMRLGRRRIADHLDLGHLVLITGSKFFAGPPFSGALLVPPTIARALDGIGRIAAGLQDYATRSDWPTRWSVLRSQFAARPNFGQWLRWEAALEEIRSYYQVPDGFRRAAVRELGAGIARLIAASPSLRLQPLPDQTDDDELGLPTIFAFTVEQHGRVLTLAQCRALHAALASDDPDEADSDAPQFARCLLGQPVGWGGAADDVIAALRICISARDITDNWSDNPATAAANLRRELDRVESVVAKIETLLRRQSQQQSPEF